MTVVATFRGREIARSEGTVVVEGNHYFPREDVRDELLEPSRHHSLCPWKGVAGYWHVVVDGERSENAAWTYRHPLPLARRVKGRVAFWKDVEVREV